MWLYKAVTVKIRTSGLITLAVSGTGTGTRMKTWTNGLYSFMSNLSHCTWTVTGSTPKLFPIVLVRVSVSVPVRDTTSVITHHTSTYVSARSPAQMLHEQPQHLSVHHVRFHVYSFLSSLLPVSLHDVFKSVEVGRFSGRRSPYLYVVVQTACSKYREVWVRLQYVNLRKQETTCFPFMLVDNTDILN